MNAPTRTAMVLTVDVLGSMRQGIVDEAAKAAHAAEEARVALGDAAQFDADVVSNRAELRRLQADIERVERDIDQSATRAANAREVNRHQAGIAAAAGRKVVQITSVINDHMAEGWPEWAVCEPCRRPIVKRGSAWGHDVEGFPAECEPGRPDSTFATPFGTSAAVQPDYSGTPPNGVPRPASQIINGPETQVLAPVPPLPPLVEHKTDGPGLVAALQTPTAGPVS